METQYFRLFNDALRVGLGLPVVVLALLAMVIMPLPPFLLDVLFSFNISLSLVVILAVVYVLRPLDLARLAGLGLIVVGIWLTLR